MTNPAKPISSRIKASLQPENISVSLGVKRVFDILVAALGLLVLSPVLGFVAVLIKRDSAGPVFYRGRRAAMGGGEFGILKFRTMYEDDRSYVGPKVTGTDDVRITQVGKWLRDTKLNELPQLWNVLKGEMSLVGPRPEDPEIAAEWSADIRSEILSVRPGVTSPASVLYRDEESLLQGEQMMETYLHTIAPNKQRLDQLYVRYRSFWLDLDVLFWTFLVLIPQVRNYQPPESMLYVGPTTRLTQRYLNWFVVDGITTFLAFGIAGLFWRSLGPLDVGWSKSIAFAIGFALIFSLTGAILGINRIDWARANAGDAIDLLPAVFAATLVVLGINSGLAMIPARPVWENAVRDTLQNYGVVWGLEFFPNGLILMAAILATAGFVLVRYRSRLITGFLSRLMRSRRGVLAASERVLVIGGGQAGQFAVWMLNSGSAADLFHPVGIVDDDLYKQGVRIRGVDVVGRSEDIPSLVKRLDIGIIVFAIHNISEAKKLTLLEICEATQAQIVVLPDFLESLKLARTINGHGSRDIQALSGSIWTPSGIPAEQINDWLGRIDALALEGDAEALRRYIEELRGSLSG